MPSPDRVIAKVDGKEIRNSDIAPSIWDWYGYQVREDFVIARVIENEAKRLKLSVTDAEVSRMVDVQLDQLKAQVPAGKTLDQFLSEQGSPRTRLLFRARVDYLLTKIAGLSFDPTQYVNVSTLLIRPASQDLADVSKAIEKANKAFEKLSKGDAWLRVLGEYSADPSVINSEGKLGWRTLGTFPDSTQKEFKALKTGKFTKPVQTVNGFQIFRLNYRGSEAAAGDLAVLRDQVISNNRRKLLEDLIKGARIERF